MLFLQRLRRHTIKMPQLRQGKDERRGLRSKESQTAEHPVHSASIWCHSTSRTGPACFAGLEAKGDLEKNWHILPGGHVQLH